LVCLDQEKSGNPAHQLCSNKLVAEIRRTQGCQMVARFSYHKSKFGMVLEGLDWKMLVYFVAIRYILLQTGIFCGHLVHLPQLWYNVARKIWQPGRTAQKELFSRNLTVKSKSTLVLLPFPANVVLIKSRERRRESRYVK
jgi:hypothetical protein